MKWEGDRVSDNVEDRRSQGGGFGGFGGGSIGIGTIVLALLGWAVFGINPLTTVGVVSNVQQSAPQVRSAGPAKAPPADDQAAKFVGTVLADTEDVWGELFKQSGASYRRPKLVLFSGSTPTACGAGQAAMGPFYCPEDEKVYLDLKFFNTLKTQLGGGGEFAEAYVIAHEIGHHVQKLQGITDKVDSLRGRVSEAQMNALSVRLELQADCYAGVWANRANEARQIIEQGDIERAMNTAAKIGDDALQQKSRGYVVPDSFTHGSSAQRVSWFKRGLQTGSPRACDTFSSNAL